jgi:hypothetical protein
MARKAFGDWSRQTNEPLHTDCEYRLKPDPPKPREWELHIGQWATSVILVEGKAPAFGKVIRVREVLE